MQYSATTGCFYPENLAYTDAPDDLVDVTGEQYDDAMQRPPGATLAVRDGQLVIVAPPVPTDAELFAQAKATRIAQLALACRTAIYAGFVSDALGAPHTYPAQDKDQANLNACVTASLLPGLPAGWSVPFWCADSSGNWSFALHDAAQIQQAGADGMMAIQAAQARNVALAAKLNAATTVEAVQAITWENTP